VRSLARAIASRRRRVVVVGACDVDDAIARDRVDIVALDDDDDVIVSDDDVAIEDDDDASVIARARRAKRIEHSRASEDARRVRSPLARVPTTSPIVDR